MIPGPSCTPLKLSGSVKQILCDGINTLPASALEGATVTASQTGSNDLTTLTDVDGNYTFNNLGGVWTVSVVGLSSVVEVGSGNGVADFTKDNRPNGSCSEIKGSVEKFDCVGTASVPTLSGEVTLTGQDYSASTQAVDGSYTFSNVPIDTYSITFAGESKSVSVSSDSGSTTVDFSIDNRINGSCAAITGHADRTDCINQTAVTGAYAGASVMNGTTVVATTDAAGNFTIANAVNGTYNLTIDGESLTSVTVADSQGSYAAGSVTISFITSLCGGAVNPVCSLSQGYWFAKPQSTWGAGVTFGAFTYSKADGVAIWNSSNKGGLPNAKAAFTQASAIKLSNVAATAAVWADVAIIDAYFATLPTKMTASNIPKNNAANAAAGAAAGRIGQWIDANHCLEQ